VGIQIPLRGADVVPISVHWEAIEGETAAEKMREKLVAEVPRNMAGNFSEDLGLP